MAGAAGPGGAVRVEAVSDFIAPAPACVVAAEAPAGAAGAAVPEGGRVGLHAPGAAGGAEEAPVHISLHDCLACSGCVTSAESVLLEHQSGRELEERLAEGFAVVVTLSPPALVSLAQSAGLPLAEARGRLAAFFKGLGVAAVLDDSVGRDLALLEAAEEFVQRFRAHERRRAEAEAGPSSGEGVGPLPVLASECPGWVCYAEKTHGKAVLPHLAAGRSAQGVMGGLTKRLLGTRLGSPPERIYHCAVMPCYDKKLEASRPDFGPGGVPETDCVLTAGEVQGLLDERGVSLLGFEAQPLDSLVGDMGLEAGGRLPAGETASGGYAHFVFREAARQLFDMEVPPGPLPLERGRNPDFHELTLRGAGGEPLLSFALAYGFRNIQNVVRNLKRGKSKYHYVEVMACPSGCLNGGGQVKPPTGTTNKELLQALEASFGTEFGFRHPSASPGAAAARRALEDAGVDASASVRTEYHALEKAPPALTVLSNW